jgi:hypothetical protein
MSIRQPLGSRARSATALICLGLAATGAGTQAAVPPSSSPTALGTAEPASAASAVAAANAEAATRETASASAARSGASASPSSGAAASAVAGPASTASGPRACSASDAYCEPISLRWVVAALALYALAFALVRWYLIARPSLRNLEAQAESLWAWVRAHPLPSGSSGLSDDEIESRINAIRQFANPCSVRDKVFWSRGEDFVGWQLYYRLIELLVARQSPETLRAELEQAADLLAGGDASLAALSQRIKDELARSPLDPADRALALLRDLHAYASRVNADLREEVHSMLSAAGAGASPTDAAALALMQRVQAALLPSATLLAAAQTASGLPPVWQQLADQARDDILPTAAARVAAIELVAQLPGNAAACAQALDGCRDALRAAEQFAARVGAALDAAPLGPSPRRVALAVQALGEMHHQNLLDYDRRFTWHRKSLWLGATTMTLVLLVAVFVGKPIFLLVGALGGLLSRLRLAVTSGGLGESKELQWTSLLLSPLLGALTAWGGLMLVSLAVEFELLGDVFNGLHWDSPLSPKLLGVALLLGFAERLFLDVATRLQGKFDPAASVSAAPAKGA